MKPASSASGGPSRGAARGEWERTLQGAAAGEPADAGVPS